MGHEPLPNRLEIAGKIQLRDGPGVVDGRPERLLRAWRSRDTMTAPGRCVLEVGATDAAFGERA